MFASLSRLFKRSASKRQETDPSPFAARPRSPQSAPQPQAEAALPHFQPVASPEDAAESQLAEPAVREPASGNFLSIPLHVILKESPAEFRGTALPGAAAGKSFKLPVERALQQLASGAVKVTLAELKHASPSGLFKENSEHDQQLVDLPLKEILARLDRHAYSCRPHQHRIEVPESIADLFGPKGQGLADVRIASKKDTAPPSGMAPIGSSAIAKPATGKKSHSTTSFARKIPTIARRSTQPKASAQPAPEPGPIAASPNLRLAMEQANLGAKSPQGAHPAASPTPSPAPSATLMPIPLAELAKAWPQEVQQEIAEQEMTQALCEFPVAQLTADMRKGKVVYPWSQIRAWLNPPPMHTGSSPHDEVQVDIPLSVVTPFFMKRVMGGVKSQGPALASVPDVFVAARPAAAPHPLPKQAPVPGPAAPAAPASIPALSVPIQPPRPAPTPRLPASPAMSPPTAPVTPAVPAKPSSAPPENLMVPLEAVSAKWPEPILEELSGFELDEAQVDIPGPILQKGLRCGKIEGPWSQVRGWIDKVTPPTPPPPPPPPPGELPLSVVAPLFFQNRKNQGAKKSYVPTDIPDLFSAEGTPLPPGQPEAAPSTPEAPPAAPDPLPAPAQAEPAEGPKPVAPVHAAAAPSAPPQRKAANIAELFGEPKKKNWTPNEIVQRTVRLPGVAGAMIALQDGLLVAGSLPPDWKAETVAAFIPQMFGRMRQYTRELAIGDVKSLTLVVEKGPLQIFNAGLIYFAVLGNSESLMPVEEMNLIASELSRHTK